MGEIKKSPDIPFSLHGKAISGDFFTIFNIKKPPLAVFKSRIKKTYMERFVRPIQYIIFWKSEPPICVTLIRCHLCVKEQLILQHLMTILQKMFVNILSSMLAWRYYNLSNGHVKDIYLTPCG